MSSAVSSNTLAASCYAKLNLTFSILGTLPDGYHQVDTLYQSINLEDCLFFTFNKEDNNIVFDQAKSKVPQAFPFSQENLIVKAIKLFLEKINDSIGVNIAIEKNIPMAAGLAGGSADAAGALLLLNTYFQNRLSQSELSALALTIGADVPFCLHGASMRGQNKGEVLTLVPHETGMFFLVAKPSCISLSTPYVFNAFDQQADKNIKSPDTELACEALSHGKIKKLAPLLGNDFESVVFKMHPVLKQVCDDMKDNEAMAAHLTGSGPTVYGMFDDFIKTEVALASLNAKFPQFDTWICRSANRGVALMERIIE
ncbi:MAG: 4-(cytidine 5'-diphospho)-2-C-methyl-D-erythritol kinase [Cyanobacteria bacterium TGS_CYA1]|nr:4-(cytidine 5'-diphospho)-2-C-methyl-D-erythritol kinase [Cyanobacteria bacterium TGS_CYA1]